MTHLEIIESKLLDISSIAAKLNYWRFQNKKIVFTNGCFDIVHLGHVDYLSKAADCGNILIIGLNTDASVRKIKGPTRPINNEIARAKILASMRFVDAVILFDEDTPYELIKLIQPDILIKGSDYAVENIVGYDIVVAKGGTVKTIDFLDGYSTTSIEKKIKNNQN